MRQVFLISAISALLFSCSKEEEEYPFDQSPYIEFEDLTYFDNVQGVDTLIISFIVWDREGDVGLDVGDLTYPNHLYNVVLDSENNFIKHDSPFNPPFTILPAFYAHDANTHQISLFLQEELSEEFAMNRYPELNCLDYALTDEYGRPEFLAYLNRSYNNMFINFYDQDGSEYNFREIFNQDPDENCFLGDFNARLFDLFGVSLLRPVENMPFKVKRRDKYSANVSYIVPSMIWRLAFMDKKFSVRVSVMDQELNESNIASSGLVALEEITMQ